MLQRDGRVRDLEVGFRIKSGEIRDALLSGEIIELQDGKYILGVIRDVTERKQGEIEIHQRASELASLNALGRAVSGTLQLDKVISAGIENIQKATRPDLAFLFLQDGEKLILKELVSANGKGQLGEMPEHRVGACVCGLAVSEKRAFYSQNISTDMRCTWEECKEAGIRSFAALPLISGDKAFGVIGLASETERDFEIAGRIPGNAGQPGCNCNSGSSSIRGRARGASFC